MARPDTGVPDRVISAAMSAAEAVPSRASTSRTTSGVTDSEHTDAIFLLAAATSLCLVGADRGSALNFRKGEFAKAGRQTEFNLAMLKRPLISAGAIAACMMLSMGVQTWSYHKRLTEIDAQLVAQGVGEVVQRLAVQLDRDPPAAQVTFG